MFVTTDISERHRTGISFAEVRGLARVLASSSSGRSGQGR